MTLSTVTSPTAYQTLATRCLNYNKQQWKINSRLTAQFEPPDDTSTTFRSEWSHKHQSHMFKGSSWSKVENQSTPSKLRNHCSKQSPAKAKCPGTGPVQTTSCQRPPIIWSQRKLETVGLSLPETKGVKNPDSLFSHSHVSYRPNIKTLVINNLYWMKLTAISNHSVYYYLLSTKWTRH